MMNIINKTNLLIQEACDEFAARAVEAEDRGEFPGPVSTIVNCANGSIECICQRSCGTLYDCDFTIYDEHGRELYTRFEGKYTGSVEAVNTKLAKALPGVMRF